MFVTYSMCLSQTVCVCPRQSVLSQTVCHRKGFFFCQAWINLSVLAYFCLFVVISVLFRLFLSISFTVLFYLFCVFLFVSVCLCQCLSTYVHFCPFLSVSVRFCLFCLFLSISVCFCPNYGPKLSLILRHLFLIRLGLSLI